MSNFLICRGKAPFLPLLLVAKADCLVMRPKWLEKSSKQSYMLQLKPEVYIYYKKVQPFISSMSQIKTPFFGHLGFPPFFLKSGHSCPFGKTILLPPFTSWLTLVFLNLSS